MIYRVGFFLVGFPLPPPLNIREKRTLLVYLNNKIRKQMTK